MCTDHRLAFPPCRHPASGYVQGINDLVTPFLAALLSQHFDGPMEAWDIETLSEETMYAVEADAYWMLCKMLDGIQDHYTNAQPGIQRTVFKLKELVRCCCRFCVSYHTCSSPPTSLTSSVSSSWVALRCSMVFQLKQLIRCLLCPSVPFLPPPASPPPPPGAFCAMCCTAFGHLAVFALKEVLRCWALFLCITTLFPRPFCFLNCASYCRNNPLLEEQYPKLRLVIQL